MKTDMGSYRFELIYRIKCLDWEGLIGRGLTGGFRLRFDINFETDINPYRFSYQF